MKLYSKTISMLLSLSMLIQPVSYVYAADADIDMGGAEENIEIDSGADKDSATEDVYNLPDVNEDNSEIEAAFDEDVEEISDLVNVEEDVNGSYDLPNKNDGPEECDSFNDSENKKDKEINEPKENERKKTKNQAVDYSEKPDDEDKGKDSKTVSENIVFEDNKTILVKKILSIKIKNLKSKDKKRVKWVSSNPDIAPVNEKGKVKAVKRGKTIITGTIDGSVYKINLTVDDPKLLPDKKLNLDIGQTMYGSISGILSEKLKWQSKKPEVADISVSGNGFAVTAKAKGNTSIYCKIGKKKFTIKVKVSKDTYNPPSDKEEVTWTEEILYDATDDTPGEKLIKGSDGSVYTVLFYKDNQMFRNRSRSLQEIADIIKRLPSPGKRKYTLNFAVTSKSDLNPVLMDQLFDKEKCIVKITPIHETHEAVNHRYEIVKDFDVYEKFERPLVEAGWEVIVFVPSEEEDKDRITCGNSLIAKASK